MGKRKKSDNYLDDTSVYFTIAHSADAIQQLAKLIDKVNKHKVGVAIAEKELTRARDRITYALHWIDVQKRNAKARELALKINVGSGGTK